MVSEITIQNVQTGQKETFNCSPPFVIEQIDWGQPEITFDSYRVPFQIGETNSGVVVGKRAPYFIGYVVADLSGVQTAGMPVQEYYRIQEEKINEEKKKLNKLFSVYQDVIITCGDYYLKCRPAFPVKYSSLDRENNDVLCMFSVDFISYTPLFYRDEKTVVLSTIKDMFHFPLVLTANKLDEHVVFGEVMKRKSVLIENEGDVPVGCVIEIRAVAGEVQDPRIYNVTKNEYIEFQNVVLSEGDSLIINTNIGEESAVHHVISTSEDRSVVGDIVKGSKFIQIEMGSNYYAYELGSGTETSVEIKVQYTELFFNTEVM